MEGSKSKVVSAGALWADIGGHRRIIAQSERDSSFAIRSGGGAHLVVTTGWSWQKTSLVVGRVPLGRGTYRGQLIDWVNERFAFRLQPVLRCDDHKGFVVLPKRWVVERTLSWLNLCRRLSKEYEELTQSSEAMIYIAMTRVMLRKLANS